MGVGPAPQTETRQVGKRLHSEAMMTKRAVHRSSAAILALCIMIFVAGCIRLYPFEVRGRIKAVDGTPVSGVTVSMKWAQSEVLLKDPDAPQVIVPDVSSVVSAQDGTFSLTFDTDEHAFSVWPRWSAILKKQGYADEVIDISPDELQATGADRQLIVVAAYMRSVKPDP